MKFPFLEVSPNTFRPVVSLQMWGPTRHSWIDGLVDTGSDRTVIADKLARRLGINTDPLPSNFSIRSVTGHVAPCKMISMPVELRRDNESITWMAEVLIGPDSLPMCLWGFKGFLEYFDTHISGPNRTVQLVASPLLPKINPST